MRGAARRGAPARTPGTPERPCRPHLRQRQDLGGRLGALAGARMPADLGQLAHRNDSSSAATARFASRTAWTTLAPPLTASPAAKIFGFAVLPSSSTGLEQRRGTRRAAAGRSPSRPCRRGRRIRCPGSAPAAGGRSRRGRRVASRRTGRPHVPSPTNPTGFVRKRISTPSRRASSTSCVVCGHLLLRAPVEQERHVGAEPLRLDRDVDRGVAAADDGDAAPRRQAARRSSAAR